MADETNNITGSKRKRNRTNNRNSNKRRKKSKPPTTNSRRKNWIESCSESIHRIPADSLSPISCVVTRVELEVERLSPQVVGGGVKEVDELDSGAHQLNGCEDSVSNAEQDDEVNNDTVKKVSNDGADESSTGKHETQSQADANIIPSRQIATLKTNASDDAPFRISNTIQVNGIEKKIFIPVKRDASAIGPTQWQIKKQQSKKNPSQQYHHLPNGDNGDGISNPHPKHLVPDKFWAQRKRLFSKYDQGIQIEHGEMWYSVTPEVIAHHVADKLTQMAIESKKQSSECEWQRDEIVILDAFCGCGGNAIAFAKKKNVKVIAVDNDLGRLKMAANNARVYGIDTKDIVFVHADVVDVLRSYNQGSKCTSTTKSDASSVQKVHGYRIGGLELLLDAIDAIFLSPPWGGMGYENNDTFDPVSSITVESRHEDGQTTVTNGGELLHMSGKAVFDAKDGVVAYFLPRNVDGVKLGQVAVASGMDHECFELEQNVVNGKVKTVTAYFGSCLTKSTVT
ncbi:hypothetical protein ACHAXN_004988 [Cyclotella atomus]